MIDFLDLFTEGAPSLHGSPALRDATSRAALAGEGAVSSTSSISPTTHSTQHGNVGREETPPRVRLLGRTGVCQKGGGEDCAFLLRLIIIIMMLNIINIINSLIAPSNIKIKSLLIHRCFPVVPVLLHRLRSRTLHRR